jgi:hypothetical protein
LCVEISSNATYSIRVGFPTRSSGRYVEDALDQTLLRGACCDLHYFPLP